MDPSNVRGYRQQNFRSVGGENHTALKCERVTFWGCRQQWGGGLGRGETRNISRDQSVEGRVSRTNVGGGRARTGF